MKRRGILRGRNGKVLRSIINAIIPPGGAFENSASRYDLIPIAEGYIKKFNPLVRLGFPLLLRYIQLSSLLKKGKLFTRLPTEGAVEFLAEFEESRLFYKRMIMLVMKMITFLSFYHIDENAEAIGYYHLEHIKI